MAGSILTKTGLDKLSAATTEQPLNIINIAVGDGNGGFPTLSPTMTALTNEVWRGIASNPILDSANSNYVYFETNIPPEVGPFDIREIAIFDDVGDMIAIGHTSLIQKPSQVDDASLAVAVKIFIALENTSDFDLIYQNTEVTSHNALANKNAVGAHDDIYIRTITLAEAQTIDLKVGQYVKLKDRGNSIVTVKSEAQAILDGDKVDGLVGDYINVVTGNGNRLILTSKLTLKSAGVNLDGVTDTTNNFMAACEYSRHYKVKIDAKQEYGSVLYSSTADFTASGAGLLGSGVGSLELIYNGDDWTRAVVVDSGATHPAFNVINVSGSFQYGEVVTGQTTGRTSVVRALFSDSSTTALQLQPSSGGGVVDGEDILGESSGATARTTTVASELAYGTSLQNIHIRDFQLSYNRTQNINEYGQPLDWAECVGLYISGARTHSYIGNIRVVGFRYGHYELSNYYGEAGRIRAQNCWASHTIDYECNNMKLTKLTSNRSGSVLDATGWSLLYTTSYSSEIDTFANERSFGSGIILEALSGTVYTSGDVENNSTNARQFKIRGLPGADFATDDGSYTRGLVINAPRFRNDVAFEFHEGVDGVTINGADFDTVGTKNNLFIGRTVGDAAFIKNIDFVGCNYYGDNGVYGPVIPNECKSDRWLNMDYNVELSPPLDVTNGNAYPIMTLPYGAVISRVDYVADLVDPPTSSGTFTVDLGVDGNLGAVYADDTVGVSSTNLTSSPYGFYGSKTSGLNKVSSGVLRARIKDNTITSGKIRLRVFYKLTNN